MIGRLYRVLYCGILKTDRMAFQCLISICSELRDVASVKSRPAGWRSRAEMLLKHAAMLLVESQLLHATQSHARWNQAVKFGTL